MGNIDTIWSKHWVCDRTFREVALRKSVMIIVNRGIMGYGLALRLAALLEHGFGLEAFLLHHCTFYVAGKADKRTHVCK